MIKLKYCLINTNESINHFQQYFSYIVAVRFIGGGNRSTWKKTPTCRKLYDKFHHIMLYRVHLA